MGDDPPPPVLIHYLSIVYVWCDAYFTQGMFLTCFTVDKYGDTYHRASFHSLTIPSHQQGDGIQQHWTKL